MLPDKNSALLKDIEIVELPSRTFRLSAGEKTIAGYTDGIEAVRQAIFLILNVERYEHLIYSWNYGAELGGLIGKPPAFCLPEIKRRVTEALLQDTRITGVREFDFNVSKGKVRAAFVVDTVFGAVATERTVEI